MTTSQGIIRKADLLCSHLEKLNDRKINVKILAPSSKNNEEIFEKLSGFCEVKKTKAVNTRFCVVDGKSSLIFAINDEKTSPDNDFAIWVNTEFSAKGLEDLFTVVWNSS
jgi:hypothetical protein